MGRHSVHLLAAAMVGLTLLPSAHADILYWNSVTTGTWTNGNLWSNAATGGTSGVAPQNSTTADTAVFSQTGTNGTVVALLAANASIAGITINNTGATTIRSDSATPRTFTIGSSGITINPGAGALTIGSAGNMADVAIASSQTWTNNSASTFTVNGGITSSVSGTQTLSIDGSRATTLAGAIGDGSGVVALRKLGTATLTLSASNNYTGATDVLFGTLAVNGAAGRLANTSAVTVAGNSTLNLGDATNGLANRINTAAGLTLGGTAGAGTLTVFRGPASANSQSFTSLTVGQGLNSISTQNTSNTAPTITLSGASPYSRNVAGGVVNLVTTNVGVAFTTAPSGAGNVAGTANPILVGAVLSGTSFVAATSGSAVAPTYSGTWGSDVNLNVSGGDVSASSLAVNAIRFNDQTTPGRSVTLQSSGTTVVASGMILSTGTSAASGSVIASGSLSGGTITSGNGSDLLVYDNHVLSNRSPFYVPPGLTISSTITDNGTTPIALTLSGPSTVFYQNQGVNNAGSVFLNNIGNSYTGGTYLNGVAVGIAGDGALGAVPAVAGNNIFAVSGNSAIQLTTGTTFTLNANRGIVISPGAMLAIGSGVGSGYTVAVAGPISGTGTLYLNFTSGAGARTTVNLTGTNTLSGTYSVTGYLRAADGVGLSPNANLALGDNAGGALLTSGTFTRAPGTGPGQVALGGSSYGNAQAGFQADGGPLTINLGGDQRTLTWGSIAGGINNGTSLILDNSPTWLNPIDLNNAQRGVIVSTGTATMSGVLSGTGASGLSKGGFTATLLLTGSNTYAGKTSITYGNISVSSLNSVSGANVRAASNLGAPSSVANGTIDLGSSNLNGGLIYTGTGETTDRVVNLAGTTGAGTLDQSGASGTLRFTSAATATGVGAKSFVLQGSTDGIGEFAGAIVNGSGTTALTKAGTGVWRLSGTNTYTGLTTVSAGVLSVSSTAALPGIAAGATNRYTVSAGAALVAGDGVTEAEFNTLRTTGTFAANAAIGFDVGAAGRTYAGTAIANIGSGTALGFMKIGSGTLTMNVANTYTGTTTVREGTLRLGVAGALPNNSPLTLTNGGLDMATSATAAAVSITGVGSIIGSSTLTATSYAISNTTGTVVMSAPLAGAAATFTKSNAGTATLSGLSTFGGVTTVSGGVLEYTSIANSGTASALGAPAAGANSTIALSNAATLRYTGTGGHSSNRTINLATASTGTATLEAAGSGAVTLSGSITAASGAKTLLLTGTSLSDNSLGVISNPSGSTTALLKTGAGRWVLNGASTFTGPTTIEQGELVLGVNSSSSSGALGSNSATAVITIGSATGSGTASLLLKSGVIVDTRAFEVASGGSQATVIGAVDGSGTATFSSAGTTQITLGRDTTLQAADGGALVLRNEWLQASGTSVNVTVGSEGNAGAVLLGQPLAATGTVRIDRGILSLVTKDPGTPGDPVFGSLAAASAVVVGPVGSVNAVLNVGPSGTSGAYSFGSNQTLSGIGTIQLDANTPVSVAGFFSPGNSPGIFTFEGDGSGGMTTLSGTTFMEITGTTVGTAYDQVKFTSGATLNYGSGSLLLDISGIYADNTTFQLFDFASTASGSFTTISGSGSYGLLTFVRGTSGVWTSGSTTQANQTFTFTESTGTLVVVPEPATLVLAAVGIGLAGWAAVRRRK